MKRNYILNPVITGSFKPKFYWTGNFIDDAERINRPHIKAEGENENRIDETIDILNQLSGLTEITLQDAINIQNELLKNNNWKGIKSGLRTHDVSIKKGDGSTEQCPPPEDIQPLIELMFPVSATSSEELLEWYRQIQMIHPLSDLNGRVFGIIVSILNQQLIKKRK